MIMVRDVLHCRPGKVGQLVEKFRSVSEVMKDLGMTPFRVYTDISGEQFWTMILEGEYESLEAFTEGMETLLSSEGAKAAMAGYHDLVESGRREVYKVEI